MNLTRVPASARSMSRFRACCTTHAWTGCSVAPRIRTLRVPCSITARTCTLAPLRRTAVKKSSARIPCACDRRTVAARRRVDPGVLEDLPDRGRRHGDAQSRELAVDPPASPGLVLPGEPQHCRPHLAVRGWPPGPATPRQVALPAADDVGMAAQDRAEKG